MPKGLFVVREDEPREIDPPEEEKPFPEFNFLTKLDNWVHANKNVLKEARLVHFVNNEIVEKRVEKNPDYTEEEYVKELQ